MMTPLDMVRAITPGVPPSPMNKPINIPLFESSPEELKDRLTLVEVPEFFHFGGTQDLGLVSFGRFLIFLTLLSIPREQLSVLFHMSCGRNFKDPNLRGDEFRCSNLDFILSKHIKVRDQDYDEGYHSETSLLQHMFGENLDKTMTFEQLQNFHSDLKREVLKLEYYLLSDNPEEGMSLAGFAKAVAALTPSEFRGEYYQRALNLENKLVPPEDLIHQEPLLGEDFDPPLETLVGKGANQVFITLEDYEAWKECLSQLENMEQAVRLYHNEDGHFSPYGLMRSARAVAGVKLTKAQVWVLFQLFDKDEKVLLEHEDFVRLMRPHSVLQARLKGPEGLGLHLLAKCCFSCSRQCYKDWYEGVLAVDEEGDVVSPSADAEVDEDS